MLHIAMFADETLLGDGLADLFTRDAHVHLERMHRVDDASVLQVLQERCPDVIVIAGDDRLDPIHVVRLLERVQASRCVRIILVHDDENTVNLYDRRQVTISRSHDVLNLIHRAPPVE